MGPAKRRGRAARAAYASGVLLLLTGGTGAIALVRLGWQVTNAISPTLGGLLGPIFGLSVIAGGYLLEHGHRRTGKLVILLGAGVGLITLALNLLLLTLKGGNPAEGLISTALTLHGVGIFLAVYAQTVA